MLNQLKTLFPGNKTLIAAAGLAIFAGLRYYKGDLTGAGETLAMALGLIGLRVGDYPPAPAPSQPASPESPKMP